MTLSALRSFVCTVHVPLPRFVPSLSCQSDGTPVTVTATGSPSAADGFAKAKLMTLPATPAGALCVPVSTTEMPSKYQYEGSCRAAKRSSVDEEVASILRVYLVYCWAVVLTRLIIVLPSKLAEKSLGVPPRSFNQNTI